MKSMTKIFPLMILIASLTCFPSNAQTLTDAFKKGAYYGAIGNNFQYQDNDGEDQGYDNVFLYLSGETGIFHGFTIGAGITVLAKIWEENDGDADDADDELINLAYLRYALGSFKATLGRQEVDLEWIGDYHEAFSLEYSATENLLITALLTRSLAVADPDEISDRFDRLQDSDGDNAFGYALDVKYSHQEKVALNAYWLGTDNLFDGYGLKVDYDQEAFGATLHYAASIEDENGVDDGNIFHGELRGDLNHFAFLGGYIKTDNDAGAASLSLLGDNISPLEDGNYVYDADAATWYAGAEYAIGDLYLGALYGSTEYGSSSEREINIIASCDIVENLNLEAIFVDVAAELSTDDYTRSEVMITFSF